MGSFSSSLYYGFFCQSKTNLLLYYYGVYCVVFRPFIDFYTIKKVNHPLSLFSFIHIFLCKKKENKIQFISDH